MILFTLPGGIPVPVFSLLLGIGGSLGLAWSAWQAPPRHARQVVSAGLWALFGGLLGARLTYVAVNWPYYREYWREIWLVPLGGLAWSGFLVGALLAIALYAWRSHLPLGLLADRLLPLAAILVPGLWLACWPSGCAYGRLASGWWALPAPDEYGLVVSRWPVQALGALGSLGLLWLVERVPLRRPLAGGVALLAGFGLGIGVFALSWLRADPAPYWLGWRLDAWQGLLGAALAGLAWLVGWSRSQPASPLKRD